VGDVGSLTDLGGLRGAERAPNNWSSSWEIYNTHWLGFYFDLMPYHGPLWVWRELDASTAFPLLADNKVASS